MLISSIALIQILSTPANINTEQANTEQQLAKNTIPKPFNIAKVSAKSVKKVRKSYNKKDALSKKKKANILLRNITDSDLDDIEL